MTTTTNREAICPCGAIDARDHADTCMAVEDGEDGESCPSCDAALAPNPYYPGAFYDCAPCASDAMADAPVTLRAMRLEARS